MDKITNCLISSINDQEVLYWNHTIQTSIQVILTTTGYKGKHKEVHMSIENKVALECVKQCRVSLYISGAYPQLNCMKHTNVLY